MKRELVFTPLKLEEWSRGEHFYYFSKMEPTGYSLTVDVDITEMLQVLKRHKLKFYPAYLWLVTKVLNEQIAFKVAERDGVVGYYDVLTPLYAIFHDDDKTFSLMWTAYDDDFALFYRQFLEDREQFGANHGILAKKDCIPPENAYTISAVPWVSFRHFAVHSYQNKSYYFPSVEAGRFGECDGRILLPLSLTFHHAATDGYHVKEFLDTLQWEAAAFEKYLQGFSI